MPIWVCRTGSQGQHEKTYFDNNCICLTREDINFNVATSDKNTIVAHIEKLNPNAAKQTISNTWSQIDIFSNKMSIGDIVIIPKKKSSRISVAIIVGNYCFDNQKPFPLNHSRKIKVIARDIDTTDFPQDIRYSLGAFRTIFGIRQEERLIEALKKATVKFDEV